MIHKLTTKKLQLVAIGDKNVSRNDILYYSTELIDKNTHKLPVELDRNGFPCRSVSLSQKVISFSQNQLKV